MTAIYCGLCILFYFLHKLLYNRGLKCQYCGCLDSKDVDSRLNHEGTSIRRRRECVGCGKRFTTYENVDTTPIMVVKKSGNRQVFSIEKVSAGILKACEKRPIPRYKLDNLIANIEKQVTNNPDQEVTSEFIGDLIMEGLRGIDDVAYVRYAAVHREFKDINSWYDKISEIMNTKGTEEK